LKNFPVQKTRLRFVRFPEHTHPAADPLIFREKLFKQTEPLLWSPVERVELNPDKPNIKDIEPVRKIA